MKEYLAAAAAEDRPKRDNSRVVVTGVFCEQPPLNLIKSIELAGCYIVDDDFMLVNRWEKSDVAVEGDPLKNLADAYLHNSNNTSAKYEPSEAKKGLYLVEAVKSTDAEGVIFACPSFCDPALLERPMLQHVLAAHNIPYIAFKYAENSGQMQPIREQAGTFADFDQAMEQPMSAQPVAEAVKELSMLKQKEMIAGNYELLATAKEKGRKVVSTFVPGNLNELMMCFDVVNNLPEINAIQNAMRKKSGAFIMEAEKRGHSEDVCTYVKADLGSIAKGNLGPRRQAAAGSGFAAAVLYRLLHLHEMVRAPARAIQVRDRDAARAL